MADEKRDRERADRNHERSTEAHWQVAESGAEEEDRLSHAARLPDKELDGREGEAHTVDRELAR